MKTLNLKTFTMAQMPLSRRFALKQRVLLDSTGKPTYTVYLDPAQSLADVAYSRLCELLGIACAKTEFGKGLPDLDQEFVSVSRYSADWELARKWMFVHNRPLSNHSDYEKHLALSDLSYLLVWGEGAGYVTKDGYFLKANNGGAFGLRMREALGAYHQPVEEVTEILTKNINSRDLMYDFSKLDDLALESIVEFPNVENSSSSADFILERIKQAREVARQALQTIT